MRWQQCCVRAATICVCARMRQESSERLEMATTIRRLDDSNNNNLDSAQCSWYLLLLAFLWLYFTSHTHKHNIIVCPSGKKSVLYYLMLARICLNTHKMGNGRKISLVRCLPEQQRKNYISIFVVAFVSSSFLIFLYIFFPSLFRIRSRSLCYISTYLAVALITRK